MTQSSGSKAVLGAVALLVVGAALGIFADRHLHRGGSGLADADGRHVAALAELQGELNLDDEQLHRIDSVMRRHQEVLEHTWQTLHGRLGAAVDTVHQDIEAMLDPDQREGFRAWLARTAEQHDP